MNEPAPNSQRDRLFEIELVRQGIRDPRILSAMQRIPREVFVPLEFQEDAYRNAPLPIGLGQTVSQPLMVAIMLEAMQLEPDHRVLEVGTGSGYSAAILSLLASRIWSVERHPELAAGALERLRNLGIENVEIKVGDGTLGWPEAAPFDAIVVAAGGPRVPPPLLEQLTVGGRLVIPVGAHRDSQDLYRITRLGRKRIRREKLDAVRFVPLIGRDAWPDA